MSRNYSNFAKTASLAAPVAAADTSIDVDTQTDYPAPSYVIVVYEGAGTPQAAPNKEVMKASGVTDNGDGTFTLTVDRDIDGYNGGGISFSDAATVEHTVIADEVGPKRNVVQSQIAKDSSRLKYAFDFSEGQIPPEMTAHKGTWGVEGGALYCDTNGGEGILTVTGLSISPPTMIETRVVMMHRTDKFMVIPHRNDNSNYIRSGVTSTSIVLEEVSGGSVSTLAQRGNILDNHQRINSLRVKGENKFGDLRIRPFTEYLRGASANLSSIYSGGITPTTHNEIGLYADSISNGKIYFENFAVYGR
jgi:hypothetical protein